MTVIADCGHLDRLDNTFIMNDVFIHVFWSRWLWNVLFTLSSDTETVCNIISDAHGFRQSALFTDIKYALDQSWLISLNHHHQLGVNRLKVTICLSINPCDQNLTTVLLSAEFGCLMQLMRAGHVIYRESEQLDQCYYSFHSYFHFSQGFSHFVLFFWSVGNIYYKSVHLDKCY